MSKDKTKKIEKSKDKEKKTTSKGRKAFLSIFSILAFSGMAVAGHFIFKACHKKEPVVTYHSVTVHQPVDEEVKKTWQIEASTDGVTFKTGTFQVKSSDEIYVRARKITSSNDQPNGVYKICAVYGEGLKQEYNFEKSGEIYEGHFPMIQTDIDIYIVAKDDIEQYIYTKIDGESWVIDQAYPNNEIKVYKFETLFEKEPEYKTFTRTGEGGTTPFNMDVYIGNKVEEIPAHFLSQCTSFDSEIVFDENSICEKIGESFLFGCTSFNHKIIIPDSLKYIEHGFLHGCEKFNHPLNTNNVEALYVDQYDKGFMYGCTNFNSKLEIPNVRLIPSYFLYECKNFDQTLVIPTYVEKIHTNFMYCCDNFCKDLDTRLVVNCYEKAFYNSGEDFTLSVQDPNAPAYKNGLKVDGTLATKMTDLFPNIEKKEEPAAYRRWRIQFKNPS